MEDVAGQISRSLYADYGALAVLVLVNVATSYILFRYFSGELKACREEAQRSDNDWRERYDELLERMLAQVVAQAATLERVADRIREKP